MSGDGLGLAGGGGAGLEEVTLRPDELVASAAALFGRGFRLALVGAHDGPGPLRVVYLFTSGPPDRRVELHVVLDGRDRAIPSLASLSFPASRFEREMRDLFGIEPVGHPLARRLVLHQHWPSGWHPMRHDAGDVPEMLDDASPYPFVEVDGRGVYEIPVGPVHAGVIEPGHFRFSVVGETIVQMGARLWFTHKGVERLFAGRDPRAATEIAERVSGDSAVGHGLAYCLAVEAACGIDVPERARDLRAMLLELERLANHVTDIGALCNDVGFGIANAKALAVRERLFRLNAELTGHRLLRGGVVLGGAELRRLPTVAELAEIGERIAEVLDLARSSAVVMDRFAGTAVLAAHEAEEIGALGVVARASGLGHDARVAHPFVELPGGFVPARRQSGDVLARFELRGDEVVASLSLLVGLLARPGAPRALGAAPARPHAGSGSGIVEGWRGSVVHRAELDDAGRLARVKIVDPSFLTWPALAVALRDAIVPDFPLANKSFNLSYAGNDL